MNKTFIVFPDGVGIRNYLYSSIFTTIRKEIVLFHNFESSIISFLKYETKINDDIVIPEFQETTKEKFLRELICLSRLKHNARLVKNATILQNWKWKQETISKRIFYSIIEFASIFIKKYKTILFLESQYQIAIRKNDFYDAITKIFEVERPKELICTHQRGLKMATIFAVAQDLKIPNTTVIYSWDNIPKARLALKADKYFVWSEYMKNEMKLFYPEIDQEKIVITGTPQFEFYEDQDNIIDKKTFFETYNLDSNKKIICFSGDDELTSPDDPKYLEDIVYSLKKNNLEGEFQILLRPCPVDLSPRYEGILKKHQDLIKIAKPLWNFHKTKKWETIYPKFEDIKLLVSTVYYCDLVINLGSTMVFDFIMFNKACIYINYDQEIKTNPSWSVKTIYKFQHFRSMPDSTSVIWLNHKDDIYLKIVEAQSFTNIQKTLNWKKIVLDNSEYASQNILNNII